MPHEAPFQQAVACLFCAQTSTVPDEKLPQPYGHWIGNKCPQCDKEFLFVTQPPPEKP